MKFYDSFVVVKNLCHGSLRQSSLFVAVVVFPDHSSFVPHQVVGAVGGADGVLWGHAGHLCGGRLQVRTHHLRLHGRGGQFAGLVVP